MGGLIGFIVLCLIIWAVVIRPRRSRKRLEQIDKGDNHSAGRTGASASAAAQSALPTASLGVTQLELERKLLDLADIASAGEQNTLGAAVGRFAPMTGRALRRAERGAEMSGVQKLNEKYPALGEAFKRGQAVWLDHEMAPADGRLISAELLEAIAEVRRERVLAGAPIAAVSSVRGLAPLLAFGYDPTESIETARFPHVAALVSTVERVVVADVDAAWASAETFAADKILAINPPEPDRERLLHGLAVCFALGFASGLIELTSLDEALVASEAPGGDARREPTPEAAIGDLLKRDPPSAGVARLILFLKQITEGAEPTAHELNEAHGRVDDLATIAPPEDIALIRTCLGFLQELEECRFACEDRIYVGARDQILAGEMTDERFGAIRYLAKTK